MLRCVSMGCACDVIRYGMMYDADAGADAVSCIRSHTDDAPAPKRFRGGGGGGGDMDDEMSNIQHTRTYTPTHIHTHIPDTPITARTLDQHRDAYAVIVSCCAHAHA